ncbi:phage terminase large subunit GpA [Melghirimyces profundicolus]|uniref:Phage terminase large subunit GpA n=1 Tax=Melghirimyces profundicolus TaxID=1242148 RepID=A0A2T6BCY8_9BACL|nr:CD1247 N-terminal domain-containing protein [Melghirimyces profundicolus]PTX53914.1 phage terminase large subunit GpA [Melghirimyces profundicolus]
MEYQSHVTSDRIRRELAFVRGLMEGQEQKNESPEGKVLGRLIQLLDEMAEEHERLQVRLNELEEYMEAVDEDLNEMELLIYDRDEDVEEEDIGFWKVECPECGDAILVDEDYFSDGSTADVACPHCETIITVTDEGDVKKASEARQAFQQENQAPVQQ